MQLTPASVRPVSAPPAQGRRWLVWLLPPLVALVALAGYWGYLKFTSRSPTSLVGAKFHAITPVELQVKVNKEGELQAVNNIDVQCLVEGGSTIVQIVPEGAFVKKGDVLVELDSSLIHQKIDDAQLLLQTATSDATAAKEMFQIQESQNAANLDVAKVDLELGKLALEQYEEGTFPQELVTAQTAAEMARITVANKEDDLRQVRELYSKNFVTLADVKSAELALTTVKNDLAKAETALMVLEKYTHRMELAGKKNYLAQAAQKLVRTQQENASNLSKARADLDAKDQKLALLKRQFARLQEQLENCKIIAPAEGLVVYAQSSREGAGPIQDGTPVRERQTLLRLPDTAAMKAVIKVNESQVSRLASGQRASVEITGVKEPVGATLTKISPVADSSQRWWNPDVREYPVELTLDYTPPNLKPGIRVQSEILIDSLPNALAVPLAALYAAGNDTYVFVKKPDGGVNPTRVAVAESNETHVRVSDGLTVDQQVLLLGPGQGRELLEKAGIQLTAADPSKIHGKRNPDAPPKDDATGAPPKDDPKRAPDGAPPKERKERGPKVARQSPRGDS